MKLLSIISLLLAFAFGEGDAEPEPNGTSHCHIFYPDPKEVAALACGHFVTEQDVTAPCGDSPEEPCLTTGQGIVWGSEDCGKCYAVTLHSPHIQDDECPDLKCHGYSQTIFLKVQDGNYGEQRFEIGQAGWTKLCPYLCHSTDYCVKDPAHCAHGIYEDEEMENPVDPGSIVVKPQSCHAFHKPITWEEVGCKDQSPHPPTEEPKPTSSSSSTSKTAPSTPSGPGNRPTGFPELPGEGPGNRPTGKPEGPGNRPTGTPEGPGNRPTGTPEGPGNRPTSPPQGSTKTVVPGESLLGAMGCQMSYTGHHTACDVGVEAAHVQGICGTPHRPCLVAMAGLQYGSAQCGECYELSFKKPSVEDESCNGGVCPPYERSVVVKIAETHGGPNDVGAFQNTWEMLCPLVCNGGSTCVQKANECVNGFVAGQDLPNPVIPGATEYMPGSCFADAHQIEAVKVACVEKETY